ncbi:heme-binding protein [Pseudonocardia endophytica]|uniref:Uncharacterized protein n=1 Tax=Pseudonocardia endophytica TaxID=401976 RepID=A0A4R1HJC4_PSEEN|nr:heme-binding protein [Pseudonocardia endophytica]TCK22397.1 hypothetical protein EV378_6399 [Pseudonocardia endophytica]
MTMWDGRLPRLQEMERTVEPAQWGDDDLGPLKDLPGTWEGHGTGWNMIALPFAGGPGFRLLLNQYDETLKFDLVDKAVPNRGVDAGQQTDQRIVTLDYEQVIHQVAVVDEPASQFQGAVGAAIHHEPGLFLNMANLTEDGLDVARLATIPHGDSVLALGTSNPADTVDIPAVNGLPLGVEHDLSSRYLAPYKKFDDSPFFGTVPADAPGFPGFNPVEPHKLLELANQGVTFTRVTVLELDTTFDTGGIHNIPFVVKQANAASMKSTFWISELAPEQPGGSPVLRLQYLQIVMLDFLPRFDGLPGRIGWPHVSINTLTKAA